MCKAIDDLIEEERNEGRKEGKVQTKRHVNVSIS